MSANKTSLRDIAREAGVSVTLVSYILNNKMPERINIETAKKVKAVARSLNYQANNLARSLKTRQTKTFGLIVADITNPFFYELARIIENMAELKGYTVLIASADEDATRFSKLADTFLMRQVDGLILAAPQGSERKLRELRKRKVPIVLIDRYFEGISLNNVVLNNYQASFNGVAFLADKGYRKIGMITLTSPLAHLKDRFEGYKAGLKSKKLRYIAQNTAHISDHASVTEMKSVLQEMFKSKDRPDALLLATNNIAVSTMQAVKQLNIKVPEQLALICFDETDLAELFYAPITYIKQPLQQMGEWAVETLTAEINGGKHKSHAQLNEVIIERASA